jgi:hypothetical protein
MIVNAGGKVSGMELDIKRCVGMKINKFENPWL